MNVNLEKNEGLKKRYNTPTMSIYNMPSMGNLLNGSPGAGGDQTPDPEEE